MTQSWFARCDFEPRMAADSAAAAPALYFELAGFSGESHEEDSVGTDLERGLRSGAGLCAGVACVCGSRCGNCEHRLERIRLENPPGLPARPALGNRSGLHRSRPLPGFERRLAVPRLYR